MDPETRHRAHQHTIRLTKQRKKKKTLTMVSDLKSWILSAVLWIYFLIRLNLTRVKFKFSFVCFFNIYFLYTFVTDHQTKDYVITYTRLTDGNAPTRMLLWSGRGYGRVYMNDSSQWVGQTPPYVQAASSFSLIMNTIIFLFFLAKANLSDHLKTTTFVPQCTWIRDTRQTQSWSFNRGVFSLIWAVSCPCTSTVF